MNDYRGYAIVGFAVAAVCLLCAASSGLVKEVADLTAKINEMEHSLNEKLMNKLTETINEKLNEKAQATELSAVKRELSAVKKTADKSHRFCKSFALGRVDYRRDDLGVGPTFFHHAFKARDKRDVDGHVHKLILPGLDELDGKVACWVLDWDSNWNKD